MTSALCGGYEKATTKIKKLIGEEKYEQLVLYNPRKILNNEELEN